jgi:NAD(P)-dependent dehydrogenase (short-subunit alcohol dehydrogenase family)
MAVFLQVKRWTIMVPQWIFTLAALPVLYMSANIFLRRSYPVHNPSSGGIVLVTGASSGIGLHAAETLAAQGYLVFAGVRNDEDSDRINNFKLRTMQPILLDVTKREDNERAIEYIQAECEKRGVPFVALVNNAGVATRGAVERVDLNEARRVFDINFWGAAELTQLALPLLRQSHGRVIFVSTVAAIVGSPLSGFYVASKRALEGLADVLRREVAGYDVAVSIVQPGAVHSRILGKTIDSGWVNDAVGKEVYPQYYNEEKIMINKERFERTASTPASTSAAILDAITSPHPQSRYQTAKLGFLSTRFVAILCWLAPEHLIDLFISKVFG